MFSVCNMMDIIKRHLILLSVSPKVYLFKLARMLPFLFFSPYWGREDSLLFIYLGVAN